MRKLLIAILVLAALPLQAQEYTSRYFHYNTYFDAPAPFTMTATTADASDSEAWEWCAGGDCLATRGAYIAAYGNEHANHGLLSLVAGSDAGNGAITFSTGGLQHLSIPDSITDSAALVFGLSTDSSPTFIVRSAKADAADDGTLQLTAGGAYGTTRGAGIQMLGDDYGGAAAGGTLTLLAGTGTAGNIEFQTAGITHLTVPQSITAAAALVYGLAADSSPSLVVRSAKADAADDGTLQLTAGGAWGTTRGAGIQMLGDDYGGAGAGGGITYEAGTGTTATHNFQVAGNLDWTIAANITQNVTNGGNIIMTKQDSNLQIGTATLQTDVSSNNGIPNLYLFNSTNTGHEVVMQGSADTVAPQINFHKSRKTDGTADTVVVNGDYLGAFNFYGANGATFNRGAYIRVAVDGAVGGASDMPGRIEFGVTPDGSGTAAEALRISNDKAALFAGTVRTSATDIGWRVATGANTACTTTCGAGKGCVFGQDTDAATHPIVSCSDAAADRCICTTT